MKIVADDKIPFLKGALEPFADVVYMPGREINRTAVKDADALIIRTRTKCNEELLSGTNVKFIGTATIGYDHIDTHYCEKNNITWTNAPGCNSTSVMQYVTAAILHLSHEYGFNPQDKTLGIIGVGNVGSKVEKIAGILGMKVMLNDPPRARKEGNGKFVLLGDILYNSDIITIHAPLNIVGEDLTYHLFDEKSFKKMKKGAWLINSSRGEIVESPALKKALGTEKISAVIDVWENEPDIDKGNMDMAFIATPHIAGYSTDGKANGTSMIVNSLCIFFGLPREEWYPQDVPAPEKPEITIDVAGKTDTEIIREAVKHSYNIMYDDYRLRLKPGDFEKQRGDYYLRREFTSYTVKLTGKNESAKNKLEQMGFNLQQGSAEGIRYEA
jgi:erythronate-4-phosphate dehydrogenase